MVTLYGVLTMATFVVGFGTLLGMLLFDRRDKQRQREFEAQCREFWKKREYVPRDPDFDDLEKAYAQVKGWEAERKARQQKEKELT